MRKVVVGILILAGFYIVDGLIGRRSSRQVSSPKRITATFS